MSQLTVAARARVEMWPAASSVAAPAVKLRRVIIEPLRLLRARRLRSSRMPINCNRVVGRHEAAFDIVVDGCRRALPGIADAGAAWRQDHQPVVRRHLLK